MSKDKAKEWVVKELDLIEKSKVQNSQILIEGDIIVPEFKPDLSRIINYTGEIYEKSIKISDNQFTYTGELVLDILYYCDNGNYGIYGMKSILPIHETVYLEGLKAEDPVKIKCHCKLVHLECAVVNDRKISVRGVGDLDYFIENSKTQKIIVPLENSDNKMAFLQKVLNLEKTLDDKKDHYKVKEEIMLNENLPAIGEILKIRSKMVEKEIRPMDEKVVIHSNVMVDVVYRDDQGLCHVSRNKIPFHSYMDSKTVTPKSSIMIDFILNPTKVDIVVNEDGEARIFEIELNIDGYMQAFAEQEFSLVTDAYMPNSTTETKIETFSYTIPVGALENQFHIREKIAFEKDQPPMMQVENTWGEITIDSIIVENGIVEVNGILNSEIMYLSGEDNAPMHIVEESIPFVQKIELKDAKFDDEISVRGNVEEIDFQIYSGLEGELISRILIEVVGKRNLQEDAIVDIELSQDEANEKRTAGAVIYTVQSGDSLWDIAKNHNTTMEYVKEMNGIEEVEEGANVLIFRS